MFEMFHHPIKASLDVASLGAIVGASWGHLPEVAAIAGGVWYSIQIVEWIWQRARPKSSRKKTKVD
jgi:hypothetical protein